MKRIINRFFGVEHMLREDRKIGTIPSSKEVYRRAMKMAWPSITESVLISIISSIDMMMVGVLGTAAIASVGLTTQPRMILLAVIFSLNAGVTAVVARRKGEEDVEKANQTLRNSILLCLIASIVLSAGGFLFAKEIMAFCGAKADTIADATIYFQVMCCGLIFNALSMTINAAQRGAGNTKISMRSNITANIVNVIFNYLLINGNLGFPKLGVAGAALATNIGFFVAFIMASLSLCKNTNFLRLRIKDSWRFDKGTLKTLYSISGSAFVEQVFFRIGFFINARIVVELGTIAFAVYQIGMQVINLSFAFGDGLAIAGSALMGQSLGAKRSDMAAIYGKVLQRISFILATFLFVIFITMGGPIVSLFDKSPEVIAVGAQVLVIIGFTTHIQTSQIVISGCLRGAGDTKFVAMVAMISTAIIRPLSTYLLCFPLGYAVLGAWFALFIDQIIRLGLNYYRFHTGKWAEIHI